MSDSIDSIQAQLAALRQGFAEQLPQRLATIAAAHAAWYDSGAPERLAEYHRLAHSLTGAGATFGFERVSQTARRLERYLKELIEGGHPPSPERLLEAARLLDAVRAAALGVPQPEEKSDAVADVNEAAPHGGDGRLVYLLGDDEIIESGIARQLTHFGYHIESFGAAEVLQQAVAARRPAMLLADIDLPDGEQKGIEAVRAVQGQQSTPLPVIFFADHADFDARLAAVRVWGEAYLPKPLAIERLVDVMDGLVEQELREPFRVLVVDDQPDQARRHALMLRQAGVIAEVMTDSMKVFSTLEEFAPELILMDMYMPHCNGLELAAVIRQQPDYVGVPIVFLSSETDRNIQFDAMRAGGDDFLTKPIESAELIQSVTIRAERYRTLRSLMSRDSLTGLLNHTHVMERLEHEVGRAGRYGAALSFAMLDIDLFKRVNDSHGHAAGDAVLKSLARLLQQRLRKSDIIGRYGGEEFAIIMPETPLANAVRVMDEVRRLFGEIIHYAGDESFTVTLSAGVAAIPPVSRFGELQVQADKRLYHAKRSGRNQVFGGDI